MKLLTPEEVAEIFRLKPGSMRDPRVRLRIGLKAVRVGGSLRFRETDVERVIKNGEERLPLAAER